MSWDYSVECSLGTFFPGDLETTKKMLSRIQRVDSGAQMYKYITKDEKVLVENPEAFNG